jgi:hypothetical protein
MLQSYRGQNEIALNSPLLRADGTPTAESPHFSDRLRTSAAISLQSIREAIGDGIPTYGSLIGLEIFLFLCERELQAQPVRLKDLYLELTRSQGGVRRLVRQLEGDGWIQIRPSEQDRRTHFVIPTARLRKAFAAFMSVTNG